MKTRAKSKANPAPLEASKDQTDSLSYSTLQTPIPPHLRARLQAVAAVTGRSVAELLEGWLAKEIESLDDDRREVADRIASAALNVAP